jgi:hypothetical protein
VLCQLQGNRDLAGWWAVSWIILCLKDRLAFVVEFNEGRDVTHGIILEDGTLMGVMEHPHKSLDSRGGFVESGCVGECLALIARVG